MERSAKEGKTFEIRFKKSAEKEYLKLSHIEQKRVASKINLLSSNPFPAGYKKLVDKELDLYRIRFGDYRIIYLVERNILTIIIVKIGHRREIYRH